MAVGFYLCRWQTHIHLVYKQCLFLEIFPLTCLVVGKCVYIRYINLYVWGTFGILFSIQPPTHMHTYTCFFFSWCISTKTCQVHATVLTMVYVTSDSWLISVLFSKWNFIVRLDQITGLSCSLTPFKKNRKKTKKICPFSPHHQNYFFTNRGTAC